MLSWELRTLSEEVLEGQGASLEASEAARSSPETSRSSSKVTKMSSRKIGNLSFSMRLVSPEGGKIAQIGSLARWNRVDSRPSEGGGLFDYLGCLGDPAGSVRLSEIVAILWAPSQRLGVPPKEVLELRKMGSSAQDLPGAAQGRPEAPQK